jgi:dihydroorotate dehydrogenase (fumarate)
MGVDLSTNYLGLKLRNPLVVAACPLTATVESLKQVVECGAAAVVLPSLFAEQIEHDEQAVDGLYEHQAESFAESTSYFPQMSDWHTGPQHYLDLIADSKQAVDVPVIASLNGSSEGSWVRHARLIQDAGADALELNIYFVPTSRSETSEVIEARYTQLVSAVRQTISIPLAVKVGPFFSSLPNLATRLHQCGAGGLVLFNRYLDPDIDTEALQISPSLVLSDRHELRLALRWIATLRDNLDLSLAATSGIHFSEDVVKSLLAGADIAMMAAALLRYGPTWLQTVLTELTRWLENKEYESVEQLKGSMSLQNYDDASAYHRANYMKAVVSYTSNLL